MAVYVAKCLVAIAEELRLNVRQLVWQFEQWKAHPDRSSDSVFFGKDYPYAEPLVPGYGRVLRHAHMLPIKDLEAHRRWITVWKRRGEKTSDKALIYVQSESGDSLLIYVLDEPGAHVRAREEPRMMMHFARLAARFLDGDFAECEAAA